MRFCDSVISRSSGVFCPMSWCASTLIGSTNNSQVTLGIDTPIFLNREDSKGAR